MSQNTIVATRHLSKNSVGDVIHITDRMGVSYEDIRQMNEDAVYRMLYPYKLMVETLYALPDYE